MTIRVALTNLGKYNEGELVFEWLDLPATDIEIDKAMKAIGIGEKRWDGGVYEEHFISDYEGPIEIGEYSNIWDLSDALDVMEQDGLLDDLLALADDKGDVEAFINLAYQSENEDLIEEIISSEELDEIVAHQAKDSGWQRVYYLLKGIDWMNDEYYRVNGYGNIENLTADYKEMIADEVIANVLSKYGFNA